MPNDHTPFSYTPGGLDLTHARSQLFERQMSRNATAESDQPQQQPVPSTYRSGTVQLTPSDDNDVSPDLLRGSDKESPTAPTLQASVSPPPMMARRAMSTDFSQSDPATRQPHDLARSQSSGAPPVPPKPSSKPPPTPPVTLHSRRPPPIVQRRAGLTNPPAMAMFHSATVQIPSVDDDLSPDLLRGSDMESPTSPTLHDSASPPTTMARRAMSTDNSESTHAIRQPGLMRSQSSGGSSGAPPVPPKPSSKPPPTPPVMKHSRRPPLMVSCRVGPADFSDPVPVICQSADTVPAPSDSEEDDVSPVLLRRSVMEPPTPPAVLAHRVGSTDFSQFVISKNSLLLATDPPHEMPVPSTYQSGTVATPIDEGDVSPVQLRRSDTEPTTSPAVQENRTVLTDASEGDCSPDLDVEEPKKVLAEARCTFKARKRLENETRQEYTSVLETLIAACEYGDAAEWIVDERVSSEFAGEPTESTPTTPTPGDEIGEVQTNVRASNPSSNSVTGVAAWKESAKEHQLEIQDLLFGTREYDYIEATDYGRSLLRKKISFVLFGPPTSEKFTLSEMEEKILTKIFNLVCEKNAGHKAFRISFVCVECLVEGKPSYSYVIRLHLADETSEKMEKSIFIDDMSRSYADFKHYLKTNNLPKCIMCYPSTGTYFMHSRVEKLEVKFRKSPACKVINQVLSSADKLSTAITKAALAAGAACATLFPATSPVVIAGAWFAGGSATLYKMGRSIGTLVDRGRHGQTVGITSTEARDCWLTIGGTARTLASADPFFQVEEDKQGPLFESMSTSGLGVVNAVANIVQKVLQGETISKMEWEYLLSASFVFGNVVMTIFQAKALLTEMSKNNIKSDNFLKDLVVLVKERSEFLKLANPNQVVNLAILGMFYTLPFPTVDLPSCFKATCKIVSGSAKLFTMNSSTPAEHARVISSELNEFWIAFGNEMQSMVEWFCKIKGKSSLCEVFGDITLKDTRAFICRLVAMLSWFRNQGADNNAHDRLASVIKLQEETGTVQPEDGAEKWIEEFARIHEILKNQLNWQKTDYEKGFEVAKKNSPNVTKSEYQEMLEISCPVSEYFWEKALIQIRKDFSGRASLLKLATGIFVITPGSSCLEDVETGTTVHFFHGVTPGGSDQQLTRDQYFSVTREKLGSVLDNGATLMIESGSRMGFFRDVPNNAEGITCVIVTCVPEEGFVAGHIFVVRN